MIKLKTGPLGRKEIVRGRGGRRFGGLVRFGARHGQGHGGGRWKRIARKIVRTPEGTVMGFILSSAQDVAQIAPAVATRWNVTVYQQRRRRIGGSLYWDRVTDFDGATAEEATKKAQDYVRGKGWKLADGGGAA